MSFTQPKAACAGLPGLQEASGYFRSQLKPDGRGRSQSTSAGPEAGSDAACERVDFCSCEKPWSVREEILGQRIRLRVQLSDTFLRQNTNQRT